MRKNRRTFLSPAKRWINGIGGRSQRDRHGDSGAVALEMPWYYRNHRKPVPFTGLVPWFSAVGGFCAALALTAGSASRTEVRRAPKPTPVAKAAAPSVAKPARKPVAVGRPAARRVAAPAVAAANAGRTAVSSRSVSRRWDRDLHGVPPPGTYLRSYRVRATAYTPINTPMEGGRWTATMRDGRSAHGVAVDPRLIPLGTHLWIPGYGHAVADDTGGAIKGHRVDVRMQNYQEMTDWGVKRLRVYVLSEPE